MYITEITYQDRRDLQVIYKCDHCGHEITGRAYDDEHYHNVTIPNKICSSCEKTAGKDYVPRKPKYPEGYQI